MTLYILTLECILPILFSIYLLRSWQGEFVQQSRASLVGDHFLYSHDLSNWFKDKIVRRNWIAVILRVKGWEIFSSTWWDVFTFYCFLWMQMNHILQELFIDTIFTLSNRRSHSYLSQRGVQFRWAWSHWGVQTSRSTGVTRNTGKQYSALINGLSLRATACMKIFCNWEAKNENLNLGANLKNEAFYFPFPTLL